MITSDHRTERNLAALGTDIIGSEHGKGPLGMITPDKHLFYPNAPTRASEVFA